MSKHSDDDNPPTLLALNGGGGRESRTNVDLNLRAKRFSPQIPARLLNLSTRGAFIETLPERENRIIDLEFSFPGQKGSFLITSRIRWCNRPDVVHAQLNKPLGMGIEFLRFIRGTVEELAQHLRQWDDNRGDGKLRHLQSISERYLVPSKAPVPATNEDTDVAYGDCTYSLYTLTEEEIERDLQHSLETLIQEKNRGTGKDFSGN